MWKIDRCQMKDQYKAIDLKLISVGHIGVEIETGRTRMNIRTESRQGVSVTHDCLEARPQFHELGYGRKRYFVFFSSSSSNTNQESTQYSTLTLNKHNKQYTKQTILSSHSNTKQRTKLNHNTTVTLTV